MIAIVDYGRGNLYSVEKAFSALGVQAIVSRDAALIAEAAKVVLPGVGAFGDCMHNLQQYGLVDAVRRAIADQKPFLGICLGLQLLFEGSEENPGVAGLGVFKGMVKKVVAPGLKIPHMGWNGLTKCSGSRLLAGLADNTYVYFVHSYHAVPADSGIITATADYGGSVTAAVGCGNVQAVQFHPEKSGQTGLDILARFTQL